MHFYPGEHRWELMGEDEWGWAVYRCYRFGCGKWLREREWTSELVTDRDAIIKLKASVQRRSEQEE